jgi:hypothetical protein
MEIKKHRPEEIVTKLRQVEVLVGQGIRPAFQEPVAQTLSMADMINRH